MFFGVYGISRHQEFHTGVGRRRLSTPFDSPSDWTPGWSLDDLVFEFNPPPSLFVRRYTQNCWRSTKTTYDGIAKT